jgi:tight adherence protein B
MIAAVPALLLPVSLPLPVLRAVQRRRERKLREQSDALAFELSLHLKCGIPVEEAALLCAGGLGPPISLCTQALRDLQPGSQDGGEALLGAARTLGHRDLELIALAADASRRTGSDIRAVMDNVGDAVRERIAIRRELEAHTVQGALSGKLVASLPFIFLGLSALVSRRTVLALLGTPQGLLMLAVAACLDALGFLWIRKILDVKT